jgi:hypothetical protein
MELVLGSLHLDAPGGATTYLLTVAAHLQRLGHGVTLYTEDPGLMARAADDQGLRVARRPRALPSECDALISIDCYIAYTLAKRFRDVPHVYVCHGAKFDIDMPPQLRDTISTVVAMNDRTVRRADAMALDVPVVRLCQPIDYERFRPRSFVRERPRRAVLLGNYMRGPRRAAVVAACERAGLEWTQIGREAGVSLTPERVLADADVVIGQGRSLLEGMSCGCAAYVYEVMGDGWVTADRYPAMEADGFGGAAFDETLDAGELACEVAGYDPDMGRVNRELIVKHHSPYKHAAELARLLGRLAPRRPDRDAPLVEMARLVRAQWSWEARAWALGRELDELRCRAEAAEQRERGEVARHPAGDKPKT